MMLGGIMLEEVVMSTSSSARLSEEEVRARLVAYEDTGITDELYDFGKMLVSEAINRINRLDTKAASIAAYSVGIITLLASTSSTWIPRMHGLWSSTLVISGVLAFVGASCAVKGLVLRPIEWFSENEWLSQECLSSRERLRKYRILTMWGVLTSWSEAGKNKSAWIARAQYALLAAAILLVVSLCTAALGRLF
jgi:hypothetical protein